MISIFKFYLLNMKIWSLNFLHYFFPNTANNTLIYPILKDHGFRTTSLASTSIFLSIFFSFIPFNFVSVATVLV